MRILFIYLFFWLKNKRAPFQSFFGYVQRTVYLSNNNKKNNNLKSYIIQGRSKDQSYGNSCYQMLCVKLFNILKLILYSNSLHMTNLTNTLICIQNFTLFNVFFKGGGTGGRLKNKRELFFWLCTNNSFYMHQILSF